MGAPPAQGGYGAPAGQYGAQPGQYGAPPGQYGAPPGGFGPPPGEKKSRTGLIIGIVAGVVVLAAIVVGAILLMGNSKSDVAESTTTQTTKGSMLSSTTTRAGNGNSDDGEGVPLNGAKIESEITKGIADQTSLTATVECPPNMTGAAGDVILCDVTLSDGTTTVITLTVQDNQGNVQWKLESP